MNPQCFSLWPTNIMVAQLPELSPHNSELSRLGREFFLKNVNSTSAFAYRGNTSSMMKEVRSSSLVALFEAIQTHIRLYFQNFYSDVPFAELNFRYNTFVNVQNTSKKWSLPHRHVGNQLVATYYADVKRGSSELAAQMPGGLCFHDPRPVHANWMVRRENKVMVVQPEAGTLVIFPGFAEHSTFPFFDDESEKLAIVTNVRFELASDSNADRAFSAEEIAAFQS